MTPLKGAVCAHARSPLSCGSIVYMLPKSRRGRVSVCASSEMTFTKTSTEVFLTPTPDSEVSFKL